MYADVHAEYFASASSKAKSLGGAVVLFKRWAQGRHMMDAPDGINGFFISMLFAYMLERGGQLSISMDTNQMFRAALAALAKPGFIKKGLYASGKPEEASEWQRAFKNVFIGPCGHVNIMSRISQSALDELIHEATVSTLELKKSGQSIFSLSLIHI